MHENRVSVLFLLIALAAVVATDSNFRRFRVPLLSTSAALAPSTVDFLEAHCTSAPNCSSTNPTSGEHERSMRCTRQILQQYSTWTYSPGPNQASWWTNSLSHGYSFLQLSSIVGPYSPSLTSPVEVVYSGCLSANASKDNVLNQVMTWEIVVNLLSAAFVDPFLVDAIVPVVNPTDHPPGSSSNETTTTCYNGQACTLSVASLWTAWPIEVKKNYCVESCFAAGGNGTSPALRSSRDVVVLPSIRTLDSGGQVACLCVPRRLPAVSGISPDAVGAMSMYPATTALNIGSCIASGFVVLQANFYCGPTALRTTNSNGSEGLFVCNSGCQPRTVDGCCFPGTYVSLGVSNGEGSSSEDGGSSGSSNNGDDQETVDWLQWAILCVIVFGCAEGAAFWVFQRSYFRQYEQERKGGNRPASRRQQPSGNDVSPGSSDAMSTGMSPLGVSLLNGMMSTTTTTLTEAESFALADAIIDQRRYVPPPPPPLPLLQHSHADGSMLLSSPSFDHFSDMGNNGGGSGGGGDDDAQEMLYLYQEVRKHLTASGQQQQPPTTVTAVREEEDGDEDDVEDTVAATDRIFSEIFGMSPTVVNSGAASFSSAPGFVGGYPRASAAGAARSNEAGKDRCPICLDDFRAEQRRHGGTTRSSSSSFGVDMSAGHAAIRLECCHSVHRECLKRYLSHRVRRREALKCPVFGCPLVLQ
ncbi:zinc finger protein, putative [Bodo saltans]|uniref:Zinc finger protein, putative n=1 Tax=Bodo saltans TaxID=75058 RepID=A0A0S4JE36_BODSA|nr:zinc finger protein, putative [Bodo saltans]|eukprot:CUG86620.1 zinc finger protein, putative [Bodo saltans]